MLKKIIAHGRAGASRSMGPHVKQVIPSVVEHAEPFVFLDHFGPMDKMPGGGVPPHPHAGIATVTYLYEGNNTHRDSYGHQQTIHVGDVAWMKAGKGIIHSEGINDVQQGNIHGLQLWVSLPAKDKFSDPSFQYYPADKLPVKTGTGYTIKVAVGEMDGLVSPVEPTSPAYLFDVRLDKDAELEIPIHKGYTCGVYIVEGSAVVNGLESKAATMIELDINEGDTIHLKGVENAKVIVLGGQPLNEPIVAYASFVMNTPEQIRQVIMDYQEGKMGHLD